MNTQAKVEYILENMPEAKDDNKILVLAYWQLFDEIDIPERVLRDMLEHATTPETITRSRRNVTSASNIRLRDETQDIIESLKDKE